MSTRFKNMEEESNKLRDWLEANNLDAEAITSWGFSYMSEEVLASYTNYGSWSSSMMRFMRGASGLHAKNRRLVERIAYQILGKTEPKVQVSVTQPPLALINCPICGNESAVRINNDGTWSVVGVEVYENNSG